MKHTLQITLVLLALFFTAQLIGLSVVKSYFKEEALPYNIERPEIEEETSYIYLIVALFFATVIALVLAKFRAIKLWKFWFFVSVVLTLTIAFGAFLPDAVALAIAFVLALVKIFKQNIFFHNLSELFIYAGLAGLFVPLLNLASITILLVVISLYDVIAVWKTKHMVGMAKFQTKAKIFAGLHINYGKGKEAILGGGDIGFPLMFAGVALKAGWIHALFVIIFTTLALALLFFLSKKDRYYPAMPFLTIGSFIGFLLSLL